MNAYELEWLDTELDTLEGDVVVQAQREVVEPRERPLMPSPFGTVVAPAAGESGPVPAA